MVQAEATVLHGEPGGALALAERRGLRAAIGQKPRGSHSGTLAIGAMEVRFVSGGVSVKVLVHVETSGVTAIDDARARDVVVEAAGEAEELGRYAEAAACDRARAREVAGGSGAARAARRVAIGGGVSDGGALIRRQCASPAGAATEPAAAVAVGASCFPPRPLIVTAPMNVAAAAKQLTRMITNNLS
jgi:hypothetical protein